MNPTSSLMSAGADPVAQLVAKVLTKYDADKDGKLSTDEFGGFLSGLLDGSARMAGTSAANPGSATPSAAGRFRAMLAGFDHGKLDNPSAPGGGTMKYTAARIFQDYPPMPESLPAVVDRLRAVGINAQQTAFDKIDFGDGYGPIDVIQGAYPGGGVAWQWLPQ
jgi:hypothetical protein